MIREDTFLHEGERFKLSILFTNCPWTIAIPYWCTQRKGFHAARTMGHPFFTDDDPHYFRTPRDKTGAHEQLLRHNYQLLARLGKVVTDQTRGRGNPMFVLLEPDGKIRSHCTKSSYSDHGRWRPI